MRLLSFAIFEVLEFLYEEKKSPSPHAGELGWCSGSHSALLMNVTTSTERRPQTRPFCDLVRDRSREKQDLFIFASEHSRKHERRPNHKNDKTTPSRLTWVTAALPYFELRPAWIRLVQILTMDFPLLPDSLPSRATPSVLNLPQIT